MKAIESRFHIFQQKYAQYLRVKSLGLMKDLLEKMQKESMLIIMLIQRFVLG